MIQMIDGLTFGEVLMELSYVAQERSSQAVQALFVFIL